MSTRGLWCPEGPATAGVQGNLGPSDRGDPLAPGAGPRAQTGGPGAQEEAGHPVSSSLGGAPADTEAAASSPALTL